MRGDTHTLSHTVSELSRRAGQIIAFDGVEPLNSGLRNVA